jgi:hypothetical protein
MLAALIVVFSSGIHSLAAADTSANGITASPALQQISLDKGQNTASFSTTVTDNTKVPMGIEITAEDFTYLGLQGDVSFISAQSASSNPHGLASSLKIEPSHVNLLPGQSQTINVTIENADALATGGHYSALVYKYLGPSTGPSGSVSINQAVTTLIFLTTYGQGTQILRLDTPVLGPLQTVVPHGIPMVFEDQGNTQTVLRGYVQLVNPSGKTIAQAIMNEGSGLILPGARRLFTVNLSGLASGYAWPGLYHLKVFYRHDGQNNFSMYEQGFIYLSLTHILVLVAVLLALVAALVLLLRLLRKRRKSKRYVK